MKKNALSRSRKSGGVGIGTLEKRQNRMGYIFALPVIVGVLMIYIPLIIQSMIYSVSDIKLGASGFTTTFKGFEEYHTALFVNPDIRKLLLSSIGRMFIDVPVIIIFSLFLANLLNGKFKGRGAARTIFFLPVIISTGIISVVESGDLMMSMYTVGSKLDVGAASSNLFNYQNLRETITEVLNNKTLSGIVMGSIDGLYTIITSSGIQMLVFLAGLQSIPASMYEAAKVEGATAWEMFWKMSFPIISPLILVNIIYTIVDSFLGVNNAMIATIRTFLGRSDFYEFASALSWIYVVIILVFISLITVIVRKAIVYQD